MDDDDNQQEMDPDQQMDEEGAPENQNMSDPDDEGEPNALDYESMDLKICGDLRKYPLKYF